MLRRRPPQAYAGGEAAFCCSERLRLIRVKLKSYKLCMRLTNGKGGLNREVDDGRSFHRSSTWRVAEGGGREGTSEWAFERPHDVGCEMAFRGEARDVRENARRLCQDGCDDAAPALGDGRGGQGSTASASAARQSGVRVTKGGVVTLPSAAWPPLRASDPAGASRASRSRP